MKRVIRSRATGEYLQADGTWSGRFDEAVCFQNTMAVLKMIQTYRLVDVELVLVMGDKVSSYDVSLKLDSCTAASQQKQRAN